eukprot:TRINITY_DN2404_c0_g2_i2.p1 TRINITY_DN2404_c0_g2~~TRINITY_DN2404_c0_g2_i2.p1  ORF type:complete len:460 (+),score=71.36 TRINITY_DN2404_c0_g2_i2:66-1445(+)
MCIRDSPYIALMAPIAGYFILRYQTKYRHLIREVTRLDANNNSKVLNHLSETSSGIITIRAFKKQNKFICDYLMKTRDKIYTELMTHALNYWSNIRLGTISVSMFFAVGVASFLSLYFNLIEQYSTLALVLAYMLLMISTIADFTYYAVWAERSFISVERVRHYLVNETEDLTAIPLPPLPSKSMSINPEEEIIFDGVRMSYTSDDASKTTWALNGVSFAIRKGEKVAFCGRTGSGKTSVLNALFRLYEIADGAIYVRGKNILNLSLAELRGSMAVIPQFGFLFQSTLRDNLDPTTSRSDEQIKQLIDKAGFKIRGVNEGLSTYNDYDQIQLNIEKVSKMMATTNVNINYEIEKSGKNLSNGEKQIINFLRILIRDASIICLDEATSNMDPKTDQALHKALFEYCEGKTLIVITHRLETIREYDRVFVMDKGEILEQGNYEALKKNAKGFFGKTGKKFQ